MTGLTRPKHPVRGTEFAGRIEAVGSKVTGFSAGELVFGFNEATLGAHAEYVVVPASRPLATIPPGMTPAEAAPTTEGAHYAMSCLETIDVGAGHEVLVYGASGAIGSAAVQLLKPGAPYLITDLGPRAQNLALIPLTRWFGGHRVRLPLPTDARAHVLQVRDLLATGRLRPVVDRTYQLDHIIEAYPYVESEQKLGTVVIDVA